MRIAVDAMGGDLGPRVVVQGVLEAARHSRASYLLVGDPSVLEPELHRADGARVQLVPASQVIEMGESPTVAYRQKPDASIVVAARLIKQEQADALVSIGNTGAAMAVSLLTLGRIPGIDRPAIATPLPSLKGTVVLLDAGATPDCDPNNLFEFAIMGAVYAQHVLGVARPRVGLLSNGEESSKGNDLVKRTHALFRQVNGETDFAFVGNVEGGDIYQGCVDVAVCDGFVGNVFLKTSEGVAEMILSLMKQELDRALLLKPFLLPLRPSLRRLKRRIDYAERGGAPLLGVNGVCIIGHGRSNAYAVKNACHAAERALQNNVINTIRKRIHEALTPPPPV